MICPCGSGRAYAACCGPCHAGTQPAPTARALMASRYAAYALGRIDYLAATTAPESRAAFDPRAAADWAAQSQWLGLKIVRCERGEASDAAGVVEFVATYRAGGRVVEHRERSEFRRDGDGRWLYVRGAAPAPAKAGRNDPCPCGSGAKFKKCCGA